MEATSQRVQEEDTLIVELSVSDENLVRHDVERQVGICDVYGTQGPETAALPQEASHWHRVPARVVPLAVAVIAWLVRWV